MDATQTLEESTVSNNYLFPRGTRYYYRRRIPADLLDHYSPKKEFLLSLNTSERREAEKRARAKAVEHDKEFERIRLSRHTPFLSSELESPTLAPESTIKAVKTQEATGESKRQILSEDPPSFGTLVAVEAADQLARLKREILRARLMDDLQDFMAMERVRFASNRAALEGREQSAYPLWKLKAIVLAQQEILEPGQHLPIKWLEKTQQATPTQVAAPTKIASETVSLEELVQLWQKDKSPGNARTILKADLVVRRFKESQGDLPVHAMTRKHCVAFRDALRAAGQSIANTNSHTDKLRALLAVAQSRDLIQQNPATGLTLKDPIPKAKKRKPFDTTSLVRIFSTKIYTAGHRPKGGAGEAAYWLPLLALLTGAREEELGQLAPSDLRQATYSDENGATVSTWIISITNEGEEQGLKNDGSAVRIVPLHPELIRLGFVEFVESRRTRSRIFYELKPDKQGRETGSWCKWFGRWLRSERCGVTDTRMVFHSFRHTFKDLCRVAEVAEPVNDAFTGHSSLNVVARAYGSDQYPLRPLVQGMQKLRLPSEVQTVLDALPQFRT